MDRFPLIRLTTTNLGTFLIAGLALLSGCSGEVTTLPPTSEATTEATSDVAAATMEPTTNPTEVILDQPTDAPTQEPTDAPPDIANSILVEDQAAGPDISVSVKRIIVDQPAWVVVGIDVDGMPGPALDFAYMKVEAGTTENITVPLRRPPPFFAQRDDGSWLLWIELYAVQGNEDESSPMVGAVPIVGPDGAMIAASFSFTLP